MCGVYRVQSFYEFEQEWRVRMEKCAALNPVGPWCESNAVGSLWCAYREEYLEYCAAKLCYRETKPFISCRIPEEVWQRIEHRVSEDRDF